MASVHYIFFPTAVTSFDIQDFQSCRGKSGKPSMVLEAVADQNTKVLFYNFGSPGCQNDITIIRMSPLLGKISNGHWPKVPFTAGSSFSSESPYLLCDGIYPEWAFLVKAFASPINPVQSLYTKRQESARKDVERCFGINRKGPLCLDQQRLREP